jgi:hypothetical protein
MTNVTSRNNVLHVTRYAIWERGQSAPGDYDYDLLNVPLSGGSAHEKHGVLGTPVYVHDHGVKGSKGILSLSPESLGIDAGAFIPNFNDGFAGSAPDIGAQEAGSPPMEFGADAYLRNASSDSQVALLAQTGTASAAARSAAPEAGTIELTREQILDHIRGGWTGMLIGGIEGLAHEFKYIQKPREDLPDFEFLPKARGLTTTTTSNGLTFSSWRKRRPEDSLSPSR